MSAETISASTMPSPVVILGSTGSIGTQALEVISVHPGRFRVLGLAAGGSNLKLLLEQTVQYRPEVVAIAKEPADQDGKQILERLRQVAGTVEIGLDAVESLAAAGPDVTVLNGITGGIGLGPTLAALRSGSTLALANKESLVVGGALVIAAMRRPGQIIPVDSEHSAIAQALLSGCHQKGLVTPVVTGKSELQEIVLTASGGPFRGWQKNQLEDITVEQALAHPTWSMGPVVTINSSTLMNKGLELIEASLLFDVDPHQITPVVHPQSIVHSMVTWQDGSTVAQAAPPSMKVPIALGLQWPTHLTGVGVPLDFSTAHSWTFEPVDNDLFPALNLAKEALLSSPTHPAVLNAANEVAVDAFLRGTLPWTGIVQVVASVLENHSGVTSPSIGDLLETQQWATREATRLIAVR